MSRLGAAVNIITTDGPAGRAGFTASAVCGVTGFASDLARVSKSQRIGKSGRARQWRPLR